VFIRTLAGSSLASFVLGIRDRHEDNMLVKDNHIFFHIDFGHLFNNGPMLDAPRIAIPDPVKTTALRESEWNELSKCLLDGFAVLRRYCETIINVATSLFNGIEDTAEINAFIRSDNSLMLESSLLSAQQRLKQFFEQSYSSVKKTLKYYAHLFKSQSPSPSKNTTPPPRTRHRSASLNVEEKPQNVIKRSFRKPKLKKDPSVPTLTIPTSKSISTISPPGSPYRPKEPRSASARHSNRPKSDSVKRTIYESDEAELSSVENQNLDVGLGENIY
jgi:hypothetical protein